MLWANLDDGAGGRGEAGEHVEWIEGIVKARARSANDVERRRRSGKDVGMQLMKNDDFVGSRFSLLDFGRSFLVSTGPMADWRAATVAICGPLGTAGSPKPGGEGVGGWGLGWVSWVTGQIHTDTFRYHLGICLSYLMLEQASRSPSPIICRLSCHRSSSIVCSFQFRDVGDFVFSHVWYRRIWLLCAVVLASSCAFGRFCPFPHVENVMLNIILRIHNHGQPTKAG